MNLKEQLKQPLVLTAMVLAIFAVVVSGMIYYFQRTKDVYPVKEYRYFNHEEVYMTVELETGHLEQYICAFPPDTDYRNIHRVKIGKMKADYLLTGPVYYCNVVK